MLKAAGQRLVYLLNPHVGHLGIFVSAKVAHFEHQAILESVDDLEALAPGFYEMRILNPTGDPDCRKPQYSVLFEEHRVENLRRYAPHSKVFARLRAVSEVNEALYRDLASPLGAGGGHPMEHGAVAVVTPDADEPLSLLREVQPLDGGCGGPGGSCSQIPTAGAE